jgi:hypothetical protein
MEKIVVPVSNLLPSKYAMAAPRTIPTENAMRTELIIRKIVHGSTSAMIFPTGVPCLTVSDIPRS